MNETTIRIKVRYDQVTARARRLLRDLDQTAQEQRQLKAAAARAYLAMGKMRAAAEPTMRSMSNYRRDQLFEELREIEKRLLEITKRGVVW